MNKFVYFSVIIVLATLTGCTTFRPHVNQYEKPVFGGCIYGCKRPDMSNANDYADYLRCEYTDVLNDRVTWDRGSGMAMAGALGLAGYRGITGDNAHQIAALAAGSATIYGVNEFLVNDKISAVYAAGIGAISCYQSESLEKSDFPREIKEEITKVDVINDTIKSTKSCKFDTNSLQAKLQSLKLSYQDINSRIGRQSIEELSKIDAKVKLEVDKALPDIHAIYGAVGSINKRISTEQFRKKSVELVEEAENVKNNADDLNIQKNKEEENKKQDVEDIKERISILNTSISEEETKLAESQNQVNGAELSQEDFGKFSSAVAESKKLLVRLQADKSEEMDNLQDAKESAETAKESAEIAAKCAFSANQIDDEINNLSAKYEAIVNNIAESGTQSQASCDISIGDRFYVGNGVDNVYNTAAAGELKIPIFKTSGQLYASSSDETVVKADIEFMPDKGSFLKLEVTAAGTADVFVTDHVQARTVRVTIIAE